MNTKQKLMKTNQNSERLQALLASIFIIAFFVGSQLLINILAK
jgi:hypothetical protein